jgi:hypothetical protein
LLFSRLIGGNIVLLGGIACDGYSKANAATHEKS